MKKYAVCDECDSDFLNRVRLKFNNDYFNRRRVPYGQDRAFSKINGKTLHSVPFHRPFKDGAYTQRADKSDRFRRRPSYPLPLEHRKGNYQDGY